MHIWLMMEKGIGYVSNSFFYLSWSTEKLLGDSQACVK